MLWGTGGAAAGAPFFDLAASPGLREVDVPELRRAIDGEAASRGQRCEERRMFVYDAPERATGAVAVWLAREGLAAETIDTAPDAVVWRARGGNRTVLGGYLRVKEQSGAGVVVACRAVAARTASGPGFNPRWVAWILGPLLAAAVTRGLVGRSAFEPR